MSIEDIARAFHLQLVLRGFQGQGNLVLLTDNRYQLLKTSKCNVFGSTDGEHPYVDRQKDLADLLADPDLVGIWANGEGVKRDLENMGEVIPKGKFFSYQRDGRNYMILG